MTLTAFQQKVQKIATYLPPWEFSPEHLGASSALLGHPEIADAHLYFRTYTPGRIAVSGGFPRDFYPLPERRPRITVSAERSARSIAEDVLRRFLPAYIPLFEEMEARAQAYAEGVAQKNVALDELAGLMSTGVHRYHDAHTEGEIYHYGPDSSRIRARTSVGDRGITVDLDLSRLPLGVARQICGVLGEMLSR